jgi:hypothetical protein
VPTGMKAGVRIGPRGVEMTPVRAAPDVALSVKEKRSVMAPGATTRAPHVQAGRLTRRALRILCGAGARFT